jgi:hypothetical protein
MENNPDNTMLNSDITEVIKLIEASVTTFGITSETFGGKLSSSFAHPLSTRELPENDINPQDILEFMLNITPPVFILEDEIEVSTLLSLEPLKERDMKALHDLFERDDVDVIAAEINKNLSFLLPALCWEEDALKFLRECA